MKKVSQKGAKEDQKGITNHRDTMTVLRQPSQRLVMARRRTGDRPSASTMASHRQYQCLTFFVARFVFLFILLFGNFWGFLM